MRRRISIKRIDIRGKDTGYSLRKPCIFFHFHYISLVYNRQDESILGGKSMKGRLFGVGVGPGDPELMTYKGSAYHKGMSSARSACEEAGNMRSATGLQQG